MGEREDNLRRAIVGMNRERMKLVALSSVYETEPMYYEEQGWFLNCGVVVETGLEPIELLRRLRAIEESLGRKPSERYGPRVIDLDVLFYGNEIVSEPGLEIPHPRMAERLFVLAPLNELRPSFVHPVLRKRISEMFETVGKEKQVIKRPGLLSGFVHR